VSPLLEPDASSLDEHLTRYVLGGHESDCDTVVQHVIDLPSDSLQEQVLVWSSVSNFHWWASLKSSGDFFSKKNQPKYSQHLLINPERKSLLPASPRNILMHCLPSLTGADLPQTLQYVSERQADIEQRFMRNLMHLVRYDQEDLDSIVSQDPPVHVEPPPPTNVELPEEPPVKKRKYTARVLTGIPEDLIDEALLASGDGEEAVESVASTRTQFDLFCEKLHLDDGFVQWRSFSNQEDVVIMNDYCPITGQWKSLDYVHVTASFTDSAEVQIQCTCRTYQYMQGKALQKVNLDNPEGTVLAPNFTCMHCRFYAEYLQPIHHSFHSQDPASPMHRKVFPTLKEVNEGVVLLGVVSPKSTTKLSVMGHDNSSPALVHIHFTSTGCYAKCQDGMCSAIFHIRKRIPQGISLRDLPKGQMCPHLHTLHYYQEFLEQLFPEFFKPKDPLPPTSSAEDNPILLEAESEPHNPNQEDIEVRGFDPGTISFNVHESKWECQSHSTHNPKDSRHDPDLVKYTRERLTHCGGELNEKGLYKGPDLFSSLAACPECGEEFCQDTDMVYRTVVVYTRYVSIIRPVICNIRPYMRAFVLRCQLYIYSVRPVILLIRPIIFILRP